MSHQWISQRSEGLIFHPLRLDEAAIIVVSQAIRRRVPRLFERRALLSAEVAEMMRQWGHDGGFSNPAIALKHGGQECPPSFPGWSRFAG